MYSVVFVIMLGIVVCNVARGDLSLWLGFVSLGIGGVLGLVMSRMFRLSWDEASSTVISRIDWLGGAILAAYILFALFRNRLFGFWVSGPALAAFTLSIVAGTMLGRVFGTVRDVRRILRAWRLGLAR